MNIRLLSLLLMVLFSPLVLSVTTAHGQKTTEQMLRFIDSLENLFLSDYAMRDWKKEKFDWDAKIEAQKMRSFVAQSNQPIAAQEFHRLVNNFVYSTKDWHVGAAFARTARSLLHFDVRGAEGRYFIVNINRDRLSQTVFPFEIGDELVSIDGIDVGELVKRYNLNGDATGERFAEMDITKRAAAWANFDLKNDVARLNLRKKSENYQQNHAHTLIWDFMPEEVPYAETFGLTFDSHNKRNFESLQQIFGRRLYMSETGFQRSREQSNPFGLGAKKSFLPAFGEIVWQADDTNYYSAYIYKTESGKRVGYVRIKDYMPFDLLASDIRESLKKPYSDLEKIMAFFNEFTDGLVIDQLNNPGGDIFYGYFIASLLTNQLIETIPERELLSPQVAMQALQRLKTLEKIVTEKDASDFARNELIGGMEVNLEHVAMFKNYYQSILDGARQGKEFTDLGYVFGMRYVNPNKNVHYQKPVVVLANELSISAGDFFPALIQDNNLATIVGTKTSGAGGYVTGAYIPNVLGINGFWLTGSIAYRKGTTPIENLGVTPDVQHDLTIRDLTEGFQDFKKVIHEALWN